MERPDILAATPEIHILIDTDGKLEKRSMARLELGRVIDFIELIEEVLDKGGKEAFKKMKDQVQATNTQLSDLMKASQGSGASMALLLQERNKELQGVGIMSYMLGIKFAKDKAYEFLGYLCNATPEEMQRQPISIVGELINGLANHPDLDDLFTLLGSIKPDTMNKIQGFGSRLTGRSSDTNAKQDSVTPMPSSSPISDSDIN